MRELAILTFTTLDGVMQGPGSPDEDPSDGFTQGGWAADHWEEVMAQVMQEAMSDPYDILFGRKTYEMFAAYWPNAANDNPVAKIMNQATKYVATKTLTKLDWQNSVPINGDLINEVTRLKKQDGPLIQVHGSGQLIQTLFAAELIDEVRLWTFPVVVGAGRRLFVPETPSRKFRLKKTAPCPNGTIMSIYRCE